MEIAAGADNDVFMITDELPEIDHHGISYPLKRALGRNQISVQVSGFRSRGLLTPET
jgi:hypothetical protein